MKDLVYLHGFASNDKAFKSQFLGHKLANYNVGFHTPNFNADIRDFKYKTITGMIARLRQYILVKEIKQPYFVASSLSGIVALHYSHRYVSPAALLLLAPMTRFIPLFSESEELFWKENNEIKINTSFADNAYLSYEFVNDARKYSKAIAPPANTTIIHGTKDETININESRKYTKTFGASLIELNAGHSLADEKSLEVIWQQSKHLLKLS